MGFKNFNIKKIGWLFLILGIVAFNLVFAVSAQELAIKLKTLIEWIIRVGVVFSFLSLAFGGFLYLTSAGDPKRTSLALKQIMGSFIGLLLLLTGWFVFPKIRPEFKTISFVPLQNIEGEPETLRQVSGLYWPFAEVPIETYLKGKEGSFQNSFLYNVDELNKTLKILMKLHPPPQEPTEGIIDILKRTANEIVDLMQQCDCKFTEARERFGICSVLRDQCLGRCWARKCCEDPCKPVRGKLTVDVQADNDLILYVFDQRSLLEKQIEWHTKSVASIYYGLAILEKCPLYLTHPREYFSRVQDYFRHQFSELKWEISRIPLLDEIETLRPWAFADFYCPQTASFEVVNLENMRPDVESLSKEIEPGYKEALEELRKLITPSPQTTGEVEGWFEEFKKLSPEQKMPLSCPMSIPFGEVIDKMVEKPLELTKLLIEIRDLLNELTKKVAEIHQVLFECSAKNCKPVCHCGWETQEECSCVCECRGNACNIAEAERLRGELNEIYGKLVEKIERAKAIIIFIRDEWLPAWEEIEKEIKAREGSLTKDYLTRIYNKYRAKNEELLPLVAFEITSAKLHHCIAQAREVEAQFDLVFCESAIGCLNPHNVPIASSTKSCPCEVMKECKVLEDNPVFVPYRCENIKEGGNLSSHDWLLYILWMFDLKLDKECYILNYFCCQQKKLK